MVSRCKIGTQKSTYKERGPDSVVGGGGHGVAEQQHEARHQGARVAGEEDLVTQPQSLRVSRHGEC